MSAFEETLSALEERVRESLDVVELREEVQKRTRGRLSDEIRTLLDRGPHEFRRREAGSRTCENRAIILTVRNLATL
jgi:hypothetical protein